MPVQSEPPKKSKAGIVILVLFLISLAALTVIFLVRYRHCLKTISQKDISKLCATKKPQEPTNVRLASVKASGGGTSTNEISL